MNKRGGASKWRFVEIPCMIRTDGHVALKDGIFSSLEKKKPLCMEHLLLQLVFW
jgi:hypothetical protein